MTQTAHLRVRCRFNGDRIENLIQVSPAFGNTPDGGDPLIEIARDRNLIYGLLNDALTGGDAAELRWGEGVSAPTPEGGRRDYTLKVKLDVPEGPLREGVIGLRERLAHEKIGFVVTGEASTLSTGRPPLRPIPFQLRVHAHGKPNWMEVCLGANTTVDAIQKAREFVLAERPDITGPVYVSMVAPATFDHFLMRNQPYAEYKGFTNKTTAKLYERVMANDQTLLEVEAAISPTTGLNLTDAIRLLSPLSEPLQPAMPENGPICWPELAGAMEERVLGKALHRAPSVRDDRDELAKRIQGQFDWRPNQRAILDLLTPTAELFRRLDLHRDHQDEPDVQARLAGRMLTDIAKNNLNSALYQPTALLEESLRSIGDRVITDTGLEYALKQRVAQLREAAPAVTAPEMSP